MVYLGTRLATVTPECHGSGLRGWTGELRKLWDEDILYKTRSKGEATVGDVRVVEEASGWLWSLWSL